MLVRLFVGGMRARRPHEWPFAAASGGARCARAKCSPEAKGKGRAASRHGCTPFVHLSAGLPPIAGDRDGLCRPLAVRYRDPSPGSGPEGPERSRRNAKQLAERNGPFIVECLETTTAINRQRLAVNRRPEPFVQWVVLRQCPITTGGGGDYAK